MARHTYFHLAVLTAAGLLGGCSYTGGMFAGSGADAVDAHAEDGQAEIVGEATPVAVEQPEPAPILTFQWDTGFSAFLTPPIEVRRQAKADCVAEGYEVAVVETMTLDGSTATARYICRGDSE